MKARRSPLPSDMDAALVSLEAEPDGTFHVRADGRAARNATLRLGRPLTDRQAFAAVLSPSGDDWGVIWNLARLPERSRTALERSIREHDLTSRILRVRGVIHQFGWAQFEVETDRGPRSFVLRGASEHVRWLTSDRVLLTDVDGTRFEIPSLAALDRRSRALLLQTL